MRKILWTAAALSAILAGCGDNSAPASRELALEYSVALCEHLHCGADEIAQCVTFELHAICDSGCVYKTECDPQTKRCASTNHCDNIGCPGEFAGDLGVAQACIDAMAERPLVCFPDGQTTHQQYLKECGSFSPTVFR